ncbi:MAG: hypothetical protein FWG32_02660 [Oscillospiraceae bacterium]|nr:hypothetical protein [Oscillospiraceae bacterium]
MNIDRVSEMSVSLNYYFKKLERFPFPDYFDGISEACEILSKSGAYLKKLLTEPGICENNGELRGAPPTLYGNYYIGEGTVIYNGVTVIGPVYIGENCEIMPGAVIRPNTVISDGCFVGHGSEVKHCVMFGGAKVASLAFVGDSVLGVSSRVGSGVITANRKFDQTNASIKLSGIKKDLGTDYFGCILGDSSRLGANSVTQPGAHIGPYSRIFPLTCVRGFIPECTAVYNKNETVFEKIEITELKP